MTHERKEFCIDLQSKSHSTNMNASKLQKESLTCWVHLSLSFLKPVMAIGEARKSWVKESNQKGRIFEGIEMIAVPWPSTNVTYTSNEFFEPS